MRSDVAPTHVSITHQPNARRVQINIGGQPFTDYLYADSLPKQVLWPIRALGNVVVTRSFPVQPLPNESTDHPHHLGHWLNHGDVNGLDFWNNSYAIPADKRALYGHIRHDAIVEAKSGAVGKLTVRATWLNAADQPLLAEQTNFRFSQVGNTRFIDRQTTLTALTDVQFKDSKEGMFAVRVARFLEMPSTQNTFTDAKGNATIAGGNVASTEQPTGMYRNSNGDTGGAVWGKTADWCLLTGKKGDTSVAIAMFDHPQNVGYPAHWHARGYGLFALNPFGQKSYTNQGEPYLLKLAAGKSLTLRYRMAITAGADPTPAQLDAWKNF